MLLPIRRFHDFFLGHGFFDQCWKPFPDAKTDDGLLDVMICRNSDLVSFLRYFYGTKTGRQLHYPDVEYQKIRSLRVTSPRPVKMQADGEYIGETPASIHVVPQALKVVVP